MPKFDCSLTAFGLLTQIPPFFEHQFYVVVEHVLWVIIYIFHETVLFSFFIEAMYLLAHYVKRLGMVSLQS